MAISLRKFKYALNCICVFGWAVGCHLDVAFRKETMDSAYSDGLGSIFDPEMR